ncbi:hypothetical protein BGW38_004537 [Lunasporangiospora selenospora]|uniref:DUF7789 domain-containing protein n=1 Tax=Lunasporangiospora selenospora TaxID=979761 RepID=A0A9P6G5A1_9FUNG|nr:hypothetical protein BGW38_004537 [Lunasporangiospora selenospora]
MSAPVHGQGPSPSSLGGYTTHPLQSSNDFVLGVPPSPTQQHPSNPPSYPHGSPNASPHTSPYTQPSVSHMDQYRAARPGPTAAAAAFHDHRIGNDHKPGSVHKHAYPLSSIQGSSGPKQHHNDSDAGSIDDKSHWRARLTKLVRFPCSVYGKSLMLTIAIEALLVIIMQAVIVVKYFDGLVDDPIVPDYPPYLDPLNQSRSIPAYLIVFVFAQLFQLVLAWDAVRAQNTIEMIAIVIFNLCCFAYSIFEISQIRTSLLDSSQFGFFGPDGMADQLQASVKPFLIVVIVAIGVTQCLVTWLAYQLFQEFGWKIYKKIGADPNMKKMYRAYQIYLVLIKIDLFFFVGFSIQFIYLTLTKRSEDPEYWLTIIVLPLTIVILYIAVYAVRHESRRWMMTFIVAMLCGVAYFVFKVTRMYVGELVGKYAGVKKFLTLFVHRDQIQHWLVV